MGWNIRGWIDSGVEWIVIFLRVKDRNKPWFKSLIAHNMSSLIRVHYSIEIPKQIQKHFKTQCWTSPKKHRVKMSVFVKYGMKYYFCFLMRVIMCNMKTFLKIYILWFIYATSKILSIQLIWPGSVLLAAQIL
jgi:hypothetical protein